MTPTSAAPAAPNLSPDFALIAERIFKIEGNRLFIGGEEIKGELRDTLRADAEYIASSRLWELMGNTIVNEASQLALVQSTKWEHVETAKMLHHWQHVFRNMIAALIKP